MISIAIPTLNIAIKQLDWQLANETLKALCGHTVRLHIKPPEMIFDVTFTPEHPVIHTKLDDQPDCTITLSPSDAPQMSLDQKAHISFNGDIHIATHFKNLLKQSSLSIESLCSQWLPERTWSIQADASYVMFNPPFSKLKRHSKTNAVITSLSNYNIARLKKRSIDLIFRSNNYVNA